jgi:hypothetical protein
MLTLMDAINRGYKWTPSMDAINAVINELMDAINRCFNLVNISECEPPHGRSDNMHSATRIDSR